MTLSNQKEVGPEEAEFDQFAQTYDADLARGLSFSGEGKDYFARKRVEWLAHCLRGIGLTPRTVLDFGCGTGSAAPFLLEILGAESIIGVDPSEKSLETARLEHASDRVRFETLEAFRPDGQCDLVFCNGVFHHIPVPERRGSVDYLRRSLRAGGLFALWENNPWNPGTRLVMSRIPFDRDAVTLTASESRRMLEAGGFAVLSTDFHFIFPKALSALRFVESFARKIPAGAQYQVLCRRVE